MPRMRGAGRKFGYGRYHSGPATITIYAYVDGATGNTRWSREIPKVVQVTAEELESHLLNEDLNEDYSVESLCDYDERARTVERTDVPEGDDDLGDVETPNQDRHGSAELNRDEVRTLLCAWEDALDSCSRCKQDACAKCRDLRTRIHNGRMCRSFFNLAERTMDDLERAAYLTTAKVLFHSTQAVRSHRDVDLVGGMFDMEKSLHEMVVQRLDECAREGEFKFEFKERLGLRPVKILSNDKVVRALYKNGSVFCEDGESAVSIAEQLGVLDLPPPPMCFQCSSHIAFRDSSLENEVEHLPLSFRRSAYLKSLKHGFCAVSLEAVPHKVQYEDAV
jgi:hypothetical protein